MLRVTVVVCNTHGYIFLDGMISLLLVVQVNFLKKKT